MKRLLFLLFLVVVSCSAPRSVIRVNNGAEGTSTTISQTTGNGGSISISVSPRTDIQLDSVQTRKRRR